ncbi:transposase [Roseovarius gahaiensis]|uniref:Transposase n=1 Tax=Roseovarius gahaiensis TaxID=2716691 RepID=A0A967BG59_9RHOB|nr:transposase [Roseovarius gahaiensis]
MGTGRTEEFRKNAVRIALTSGLTRRQVADDLGVGFSTLNKWVNAHRDTDVVSPEDREALIAFFDFLADHLDHMRTGNPIEGVFATVRHRTVRTKGALSQKATKLMVFKPVQVAAKTWRRLKGANQLPLVIEGVTFTDGVAANDTAKRAA